MQTELEKARVCPFCGQKPKFATNAYSEVTEIWCANPKCFVAPSVRAQSQYLAITRWNMREGEERGD